VQPPGDALMESTTPLPTAAEFPPSMGDAASSERCAQSSGEPRTDQDTGGGAANPGGDDLPMREPSLQHANEHSQWEGEVFGPRPPPDDDGDLGWDLEDEFKDKCMITVYPGRKSDPVRRKCISYLVEVFTNSLSNSCTFLQIRTVFRSMYTTWCYTRVNLYTKNTDLLVMYTNRFTAMQLSLLDTPSVVIYPISRMLFILSVLFVLVFKVGSLQSFNEGSFSQLQSFY
jgi:hypothetical protein